MNNNEILKTFAQKAKKRLIGQDSFSNPKIKIISNDDIDFKTKVEKLLSQEDVVTNPVHYLMDDKIFNVLDGNGKERYLLSTLDKYNRFKDQIQNASSTSRFCI